jgi:asparagine synthase (glutamine-hydrolysing)
MQSPAARLHKIGKLMQLDRLDDRYAALLSTMAKEALILDFQAGADNGPDKPDSWNLENIEDHLMRNDVSGYLPDNGLVKLDRASMRVSLEARAPFLDARIVEDAFRVPLNQKVRNGKGKWIFRSVLAKYLPPEFFERPKAGFSVPVADWLRGPLRSWIGDTLSPARLARTALLDPGEVQRLLDQHLKGDADHARVLWAIVMMESWLSR